MSYESNIPATAHFFAGEDKILSYEVFTSDGTTMENVMAFKMLSASGTSVTIIYQGGAI